MNKLVIEYRTDDTKDYVKRGTCYSFFYEDRRTVISIDPEEKRKLSEIVFGIEKQLQDGFHLQKNEHFDIDEVHKCIMEYEKENNCRVDNKIYPYTRYIFENKDNPEQIEQFLRTINK